MDAHTRVGDQADMMTAARPAIVLGRLREPGEYRLPFDETKCFQQLRVRLEQGGAIAPCEEPAALPAPVIDPADVTPTDRLHRAADAVRLTGRGEQPQAVWEQCVAVQGNARLSRCVLQRFKQAPGVGIVGEKCTRSGSLHDKMREAADSEPGETSHSTRLRQSASPTAYRRRCSRIA